VSILRSRSGLAAAALVVVIGIFAAAWLLPPLGTGTTGVASGSTFIPSGRVTFGVEVQNTTFLPVTIDGLVGGRGDFSLEDVHLVLGDGPILGLDEGQTRPFEPFSLAPGETRLIGVVGHFPDCADARPNWSTGTGQTVSVLPLELRIAGVLPAAVDVPLLQPVDLIGNFDEACPSP
jgi:hypothetical protein